MGTPSRQGGIFHLSSRAEPVSREAPSGRQSGARRVLHPLPDVVVWERSMTVSCGDREMTVSYCQLLSITVNDCQLLSTTVNYCQLQSSTVNDCQLLSTTVTYCQ